MNLFYKIFFLIYTKQVYMKGFVEYWATVKMYKVCHLLVILFNFVLDMKYFAWILIYTIIYYMTNIYIEILCY